MKLQGQIHIPNRLVSLHEIDARPITKGKSFPSCEFGTTNQMSFNRQGFMVTCEVMIGAPKDKQLYKSTLLQYKSKMQGLPPYSVTDGNYRSKENQKFAEEQGISHSFFGKSKDVKPEEQEKCKSARSATEGFIAVAKNLRGIGKSLYRGLQGDQIWAGLAQTAYNLKKFLLLYEKEEVEEDSLITLGLLLK